MVSTHSDHTSRHTINCCLTAGVHLFLTRVMGLSEEDNKARSGAGPAAHNHLHYWDTGKGKTVTIYTVSMEKRKFW